MVFTSKKEQQYKRLLGQWDPTEDIFAIGHTSMRIGKTNVINKGHENVNFPNENQSTAQSDSPVDTQTLERNISDKVGIEVENAVATVETRVHEAILSAMDNFVVARMELTMRWIGISSVPNPSSE